MSDHIKNKVASFLSFVVEKSVLGYFSNIKNGIIQFVESIPDNAAKLYYAYAILLFLTVLSVSGILVITLGGVLIIIALADPSVDKFILSGVLLTVTGLLYFIGTILMIKFIGSIVHSSLRKSTEEMLKKVKK